MTRDAKGESGTGRTGTLSALIELTANGFEPADPTATAIVFWVFGVAWGLASDRAMLGPLRTGLVLGTLTAVIAPYGIAVPTGLEIPSETTITIAAVWSFATSALAARSAATGPFRALPSPA